MFKQTLIVIVITAIAVYFAHQFGVLLNSIGHLQAWLALKIDSLAPQSTTLHYISNIITLVVVPIVIALIPAFIYWIIEKKEMPKLKELMGVLWLILLLIFVLHR